MCKFKVSCSMVFLLSLFMLAAVMLPNSFAAGQPERLGIVLLHGKTGEPFNPNMIEAARPLKQAGFLLEVPEMPWSKTRYIDKPYDQALNEIDQAVARLKAKGATKIVIAGLSMGGDAALAYAAYHGHIDGLILLSPAHTPDSDYFLNNFADDIAKAKTMIAAGNGDQYASLRMLTRAFPVCAT